MAQPLAPPTASQSHIQASGYRKPPGKTSAGSAAAGAPQASPLQGQQSGVAEAAKPQEGGASSAAAAELPRKRARADEEGRARKLQAVASPRSQGLHQQGPGEGLGRDRRRRRTAPSPAGAVQAAPSGGGAGEALIAARAVSACARAAD